jgi:hypothetical protein
MRTVMLLAAGVWLVSPLTAQTPAHDPSSTLEQVLPPDVAQQVLAHIADARSRQLPAAALEHRALELSAKGVAPADVSKAVAEQEEAMAKGKAALVSGGRSNPSDDEVDAAGTALGKGVDGAVVSTLAKSAPSGRSLAVPLAVLSSLVDRGLPSDAALQKVVARLQAHATDQELADLPAQAAAGQAHKPATTGEALAATKRPDHGGPPSSVPVNGGSDVRPTTPAAGGNPNHPPGRP